MPRLVVELEADSHGQFVHVKLDQDVATMLPADNLMLRVQELVNNKLNSICNQIQRDIKRLRQH